MVQDTFLTITSLTTQAQKANAPTFGKGILNLVGKDNIWSMKIGTRMQLLFVAFWLGRAITGRNPQKQYTFGLSKYIVGQKLKIQTDLSYLSEDGTMDELMYRLQVEVHF